MSCSNYSGHPPDCLPAVQKRHWVADIVYVPLETELLRAARAKGCRTLDGGGMAVFQAAGAFLLFTGCLADAARIPILIYSVPIFTHVTADASLVARLASHPNIVGIKDSSGNIRAIEEIIAAVPKTFRTLTGYPGTLHESLQAGASGAILALACAFPELCCEIYDASHTGDAVRSQLLAQRLQAPSKLLGQEFGISGLKYALDRLGYFGGLPRPPLLPVSKTAQHEIEEMLPGVLSVSGAAAKP